MSYVAKPIEELDALPAAEFVAELQPLFEGAPTLLTRLAGDRPFGSWWNLLARARVVAHALPEADKIELLNAHPRLGAPPESVSRLSYEEQGYGRAETTAAPSASPGPPSAPTGLRSRLEHRAAASQERPTWGSAASAGAAPLRKAAAPATPATSPAVPADEGDSTRARLARLNAAYEDWFGFRYCVFVAGRPLEALVPELEQALAQSREHELQRGVDAVVDIAVARSGTAR